MKPGLEKYEYGMKHNLQAPTTKEELVIPNDVQSALQTEIKAHEHFIDLAPSYKLMYMHWINSAKKEETRKRRIEKMIQLLKEKKKPWER